jgi:hypothetical protein
MQPSALDGLTQEEHELHLGQMPRNGLEGVCVRGIALGGFTNCRQPRRAVEEAFVLL